MPPQLSPRSWSHDPPHGDSFARRNRGASTGQLGRGGLGTPELLDMKAGQLTPLMSQLRQRSLSSGFVRNGKEEHRHIATQATNSSKREVKRRTSAILEEQHAQRVGQQRRVRAPTPEGATAARASAGGLRVSGTKDEKSDVWLFPSSITSDHIKRADVAAEKHALQWVAEQRRLSKHAPGVDETRASQKMREPPSPAGSHDGCRCDPCALKASMRRVTASHILDRLPKRRSSSVSVASIQALRETARELSRMASKSSLGSSNVDSSSQVDGQIQPKIDLLRLARELMIPNDVVRQAADKFRKHASCPATDAEAQEGSDVDPLADGVLTQEEIGKIFGDSALPATTQAMNFRQFVLWFFSRSFSEECNLTEEQRAVRSMARKYDMAISDADSYKKCFDKHDLNSSGLIDSTEFEALLNKMIRIPGGCSLPEKRVEQLWREADEENNGTINFWEFVRFYRKYFEQQEAKDGSLSCPFETFYSMSRTVSN